MIYIWLTIFLLIFAIILNNSKRKNVFIFISFSLMALIMGLRSVNVGVDTLTYYESFYLIAKTPWHVLLKSYYFEGLEIGYVILVKICTFFFNSYYSFQFVFSVIYCSFFASFCKQLKHPYVGVFVFLGSALFLESFNIARQMLAVAMFAYAWSLFFKGKKRKSTVILLLSLLMHTTSLLAIIPFVVFFLFQKKFVVYLSPVIALLMYLLFPYFLDFSIDNISHYANYYDNHKVVQEATGAKILWLIYATLSLIVIYNRTFDRQSKCAAFFTLVLVAFNFIGLKMNYVERLGLFYLPFVVLLFDSFGDLFNCVFLKRIFYMFVICFFTMYFILSSQSLQYKYSFFF